MKGRQKTSTPEQMHQEARAYPDKRQVSDLNHQVWVFQSQTLVAVPRSDNVVPVSVTLIACKYPESFEQAKGIPTYLGIKNPEMCLFCEDVDGKPTLKLKEEKIMDLYNQPGPVKPFLFYHSQEGRTSTFESVAFPGWFIASSETNQPVFLTSERGAAYNTEFNLSVAD